MLTIRSSTLLRQALVSDAATTAACGAFMLIGASLLSGTLGLPTALLAVAGAALLPCALFVGYLGVIPEASRTMILAVIGANLLWAADSALLLVSGYVEPTRAGTVFVIAQAARHPHVCGAAIHGAAPIRLRRGMTHSTAPASGRGGLDRCDDEAGRHDAQDPVGHADRAGRPAREAEDDVEGERDAERPHGRRQEGLPPSGTGDDDEADRDTRGGHHDEISEPQPGRHHSWRLARQAWLAALPPSAACAAASRAIGTR